MKKIILTLVFMMPVYVFGQSSTSNSLKSLDYLVGGTWKGTKAIKIGGQEFTPIIEYRYRADKNMIYTISYKESSDGTREVNNEGFFIPIPEKEMVHYLVFPNGGVIEGDYRVGGSDTHESDFNYYPPGGGNKSKWRSTLKKISKDTWKLTPLNSEYLSLFTSFEDGSAFDINSLPLNLDDPLEVGLDYQLVTGTGSENSEPSELELSWNLQTLPEDWKVELIDNRLNQTIDLRTSSSYVFEIDEKAKAVKGQDPGAKSSKVLETLEDSDGQTIPSHGTLFSKVLHVPSGKAKAGETSRFTLTITPTITVGTEPISDLPTSVELHQNYPNPFNPSTTIAFGVPQTGKVTLEVFDVLGRKVATLLNDENKTVGRYTVNFNASNLASGMYIYQLRTGNTVITKKLTLIK